MQRTEEASGRFKVVFSLAIIMAVAFVGIKVIPVYVNNYQLEDHIRQLSVQLSVRTKPTTPDEVKNEVVGFAQDHGIPLAADNVKVTLGTHVMIDLDYTVPVDLRVYILKLHFAPSAENRSL
jgi:cell division protein FtsL